MTVRLKINSILFIFSAVVVTVVFVQQLMQLIANFNTVESEGKLHNTSTPELRWIHVPSSRDWAIKNLVPPSETDYNFTDKSTVDFSDGHRMKSIHEKYLGAKNTGRFIEVGALDGEYYSNSAYLERAANWTGLLIEGDNTNYANLLSKNRKAYCIHAALCGSATPAILKFDSDHVSGTFCQPKKNISGLGHIVDTSEKDLSAAQVAALRKKFARTQTRKVNEVTCVQLGAILDALNWTHIDYWSLDVEGAEATVLTTFPWHVVTVDVVQIECTGCGPNEKGRDAKKREFFSIFMDSVGFDEVAYVGGDFIYQRRN